MQRMKSGKYIVKIFDKYGNPKGMIGPTDTHEQAQRLAERYKKNNRTSRLVRIHEL